MRNETTVETSIPPAAEQRQGRSGDTATAGGEGPRITVSGLAKRFHRLGGQEVVAVDDISISVGAGEFLVLLGPSGCGKTTLLRCMAGLEHPEQGRIEIDGKVVYSSAERVELPPERRRVSMMFQSYALWPHMTVFDNVAYPLRARGEKGGGGRKARQQGVRERVEAVLARVHCEHLVDQYPGSISGGQQQRIALARALVADDRVVLFDEPLSNVDAKVREELRFELLELQRKIGFSAVYVTHDQAEAMALADRIALLRNGRVAQIGAPDEVYHRPASEHVARFLGSVNELTGTASVSDRGTVVETPIGRLVASAKSPAGVADGAAVTAAWRPEASHLSAERPEGENVWRGTVKAALFLGSHREYAVDVGGVTLRVWRMEGAPVREGSEAWIAIDPADVLVFPGTGEQG